MKPVSSPVTRRQTLWMLGGAIGAVALHGCNQSISTEGASGTSNALPSTGETVSARLGSTLWVGYTPLFIAMEKGFFKEGGLDLTFNVFNSGEDAETAFISERTEALANVTTEAVALTSRGEEFRIVQVADTSYGGDGILARDTIPTIADFKGKEIAVTINTVSHFFLLQVLQEAGLTREDVTLINLTPDAAATAFQTGQVDIAVTYSPFLQKANEAQPDGRIIYDTSKMPMAIIDVYLFNTSFIEEHPEAVQAFVNGIYKGQDFLRTNPDEALGIAARALGLTAADVELELKGIALVGPTENAKILSDTTSELYLVRHMEALGQFLTDQQQISEAPTSELLTTLIDATFVKAAANT